MRLKFLLVACLSITSAAHAGGPTVTDWKDSTCPGVTCDQDTKTPIASHIYAIHGRSRPNSSNPADSSTLYEVWAVGAGGIILRNDNSPTNGWTSVASPTGQDLNDVYINPDGTGWAVGNQGTIIRYNGVNWTCNQCPTDCAACGGAGQPPAAVCTCSDLYDIEPLAPLAASSSLIVVGESGCNPPDPAYGSDYPTALYFDGATWEKVTQVTAPFSTGFPGGAAGITGWNLGSYYGCGGGNCGKSPEFNNSISYTGMNISATTFTSIQSTICRNHLQTVSPLRFVLIVGQQSTLCGIPPGINYFSSGVIGNVPVIGGDVDCGDLLNTKSVPTKTNLFFYNTGSQKVQALNTGIVGTATLWGTIRGMAFIPTLRWGIAVGWGPGDYTTVGAQAYFVRFDYQDLNRLPAPEDPASPNKIYYGNASTHAAPYNTWNRMNDVYISNYNEAWTVGNNGQTLHWVGPSIPPASLTANLTVDPPGRPAPGTIVDLVLTVSNTGGTTAVGLVPAVPTLTPVASAAGMTMMTLSCASSPSCGTSFCAPDPCPVDVPAGGSVSFTWTYSVQGCGAFLDWVSASVSGQDFLLGTPVSDFDVINWPNDLDPPNITVGLSRSPGTKTISRDSGFNYTIDVTNVGGVTLNALSAWDSSAAPIEITSIPPTPLFVSGSNPYPGGVHYYWNNAAPLTMTPGTTYSFVLNGNVGRPCTLTQVYNRARAEAGSSCIQTFRKTSGLHDFNVPGMPSGVNMALSMSRSGGTMPGQTITYRIVVNNTGAASIENLGVLVTDTVPTDIGSVSVSGPAGFTPLGPAAVPGGNWYGWRSSSWMDMGGSTYYTFTVTGQVGSPCLDTTVINRAYYSGSNFCGSGSSFVYSTEKRAVADTGYMIPGAPPIVLKVDKSWTAVPGPTPTPGGTITYQIVVTNVGTPFVDTIIVADTLAPQIVSVTTSSPTAFGAALITGSCYSWSSTLWKMTGGESYTFTITGTVGGICQTTTIGNTAWVFAASSSCGQLREASGSATPFSLDIGISLNKTQQPASPTPGNPIRYDLSVTNTGQVTITRLIVVDTIPTAALPHAPVQTPPGFTYTRTGWPLGNLAIWDGGPVAPGARVDFSVTGTVGLSCQASDIVNMAMAAGAPFACGVDPTVFSYDSASFPIMTAPITAGLSLSAKSVIAGNQLVTIYLTVSNTGAKGSTATEFIPSADVVVSATDPNEAVKVSGPTPAYYYDYLRSINDGCKAAPCRPSFVTFRWVYQVTSVEPIMFTAYATTRVFTNPANATLCTVSASASTKFTDTGDEGSFVLNRNLFRGRVETVTASWNIKETSRASLIVYNSIGQKVKTLFEGTAVRRMLYAHEWNGTNDDGERVASGAYFIRLESHRFVETRKVAIVK